MGSSNDIFGNLVPTVESTANALAAASYASATPSRRSHKPEASKSASNGNTHMPNTSFAYRNEAGRHHDDEYDTEHSGIDYDPNKDPLIYCFPTVSAPYEFPREERRQNREAPMPKAHRKGKPSPKNPGYTAKRHQRHFVIHNYHDRSNELAELSSEDYADQVTARGGVVIPFPLVLHNMLERIEEEGLSHIVSWSPHGRSFAVHDSQAFISKVMPLFFRQSKISSFQRQLNLYGFARLTRNGPDKGAYYHEYFLRGRPTLCTRLQRTRVKGTGVRTSSNPESEPDFYELSPLPAPKTGKPMERLMLPPAAAAPGLNVSRDLREEPHMIMTERVTDDRSLQPNRFLPATLPPPTAAALKTNLSNSNLADKAGNHIESTIKAFLPSPNETWHKHDGNFCFCEDKTLTEYVNGNTFDSDDDLDEVEFGRLLEEILD
jgi:hypothetical protein